MAYIEWDESLSVGVAEIDAQHRRLFELVNTLHGLCAASCPPLALLAAADEFCEYTREHFATEERYMDAHQYRGMDAHLQEHMQCSMRAVDFLGLALADDAGLRDEFLAFLKSWLDTHIRGTDMGLGAYLNKRGVA